MAKKRVYKVIFHNQGKIYELYAREIAQGHLYGFVEVGEIIFGERSAMLVDPVEERLKSEFSGVKFTYIPMHAIVRIDEVEKEGTNKIVAVEAGNKVMPFPMPSMPPHGGGDPSSS
jgi:hypothetical protein